MTSKHVLISLILVAVAGLVMMIVLPKAIVRINSYVLFLTLLAILAYSWETRKLRIQSEKQTELAGEHAELSLRPHLEIVFQRAHFRLYNIGYGPAMHIRIDDKIVSPAGHPERLRFICPAIIRKDEFLPIEVKILTEDGKHEEKSARLGFIKPPEATETVEINVHFENLIGKEYVYTLKLGKDMPNNAVPVDYLLQYLFETFPRHINPNEIPALYVEPSERMRLLLYCRDKGLIEATPIENNQQGIVDLRYIIITSRGIDYLKGKS